MSLRHLLRRSSLSQRLSSTRFPLPISHIQQRLYNISISPQNEDPETNNQPPPIPYPQFPLRTTAFSSAEEAATERRRRKRRLRIEPPLHALRRDPSSLPRNATPTLPASRTRPPPSSARVSTSTTESNP
ncbi:hypothetical protein Rs2_22352 [Raphanus sativus]|nr:hypothetical protein Rs2_22352 [Raphanus sativus]